MSYNIDTFKVKVLENLCIPLDSFVKHEREDWHPELTYIDTDKVELSCGCGQRIIGILKDNILHVTEIDMAGEGSGTFVSLILEPALKDSKGKLDASCVWEGGDTINRLIVNDGQVTWVVESRYVVVDGEKKNYCEYCLRKVMGYPVNVVKGGKKLTDGDIVLGAPNYVKIEKRCWRQSEEPCPKCGSFYEEKKSGKWVCNKCG
jgi:ribosomal protein S27AE